MPTKRRFIIFLIVLALMLLIKRAVGQETTVRWDPQSCWDCGGPSLEEWILGGVIGGLLVGSIIGACRVVERSAAARDGQYFTGDLVVLHLQ